MINIANIISGVIIVICLSISEVKITSYKWWIIMLILTIWVTSYSYIYDYFKRNSEK